MDGLTDAGARAVVVTGSHARGDAGPHSDLDVMAIGRGPRTTLFRQGEFLVSLSWRSERKERAALRDPARAGAAIPAWRNAVILHDPDGVAARLRQAAAGWTWRPLERAADAWVAEELTGFSEEVHKLVGNRDAGNSSAAAVQRSVLALRLPRIMAVHRRLLYETENALWNLVAAEMGPAWGSVQAAALGQGGEPFDDTLDAALELFRLAAAEIGGLLGERQREVVEAAGRLAAQPARPAGDRSNRTTTR